MRTSATVSTVSWIPSELVSGSLRAGFDLGLAHYDPPPPERIDSVGDLHARCRGDEFRFANVVSAWVEVFDGRIVDAGWGDDAGLVMGATTVRVAGLGATFRAVSLPTLRPEPTRSSDRVRFQQTVGGRTGVPLPRPVRHPPFLQWHAPIVWTTLALTLHADGRTEVELAGASAFPRHWVFGADGQLALKSGITEQKSWVSHSFGARTPWGEQDSPALVTAVETQLERQLSHELMHDRVPKVRKVSAGEAVTRQGEPGDELLLLLDGVLAVEVDGVRLAELGPGAVVGERAVLEGGLRTATLVAVTDVRVAVAPADALDLDRLRVLAGQHRREEEATARASTPTP